MGTTTWEMTENGTTELTEIPREGRTKSQNDAADLPERVTVLPKGDDSQSTTQKFHALRADMTNQRLAIVGRQIASHGGPHRHECQKCHEIYEHTHSEKAFAHARTYGPYCEECLSRFCYAKAMQGWLHSTPLRVMGRSDILKHARANQVTIVVASDDHVLSFGNFTHMLMVEVNHDFTHVESVHELTCLPKTDYTTWTGKVALAKHSLKEILTGLSKMDGNLVYNFYDKEDRQSTKERYAEKKNPQPNKKKEKKAEKKKKSEPKQKKPKEPVPQAASVGGKAAVPVHGVDYEVPKKASRQGVFTESSQLCQGVFGAADFGQKEMNAALWKANSLDMIPFETQIDLSRDMPLYDARHVAKSMAGFLEADVRLPRRFENTIAKKVKADALITLSALNFTEGDTVFIITPNLHASRGAIVMSKAPGDIKLDPSKLITVVVPQIDTEELGALQNVNGSMLTAGIQQSTGADSSVAAFSNAAEGCITTVSPWSTIPGKAAYATPSHESLSEMITDQDIMIGNLNYGVPDHLVRTGGTFDQQSGNVTIANNYIKPPPDSILETGDTYAIIAFGANNGTNGVLAMPETAIAPNQDVTIWRLSDHASYLRHLLYGAFHFESTLTEIQYRGDYAFSAGIWRLIVEFMDGTVETLYLREATPPVDNFDGDGIASKTPYLRFSYQGSGSPETNAGKIISEMTLLYHRSANDETADQFNLTNNLSGFMRLSFDTINAATQYSMISITGARRGQTIRVGLQAEAEILLDPTGEVARYLSPDKGPAVDAKKIAYMLTAMHQDGAYLYLTKSGRGKAIDFQAGAFGSRIKTFFKNIFKVLGPLAGTAGKLIGGVVGGAPGAAIGGAVGDAVGGMARNAADFTQHESLMDCCLET
jgi:hypothetical protein